MATYFGRNGFDRAGSLAGKTGQQPNEPNYGSARILKKTQWSSLRMVRNEPAGKTTIQISNLFSRASVV